MKKLLKKYEYPDNISCLAQGCPSCPMLKEQGIKDFNQCKYFSWKTENMGRYGVEVYNSKIRKVWLIRD